MNHQKPKTSATPIVSVIAPVYKTAPYLEQCVHSILDQLYTDIELILVDDGSPDNSGALCDCLAASDPRIKVIHKENQGLGMARNSGLEVARGEYIMFIDSDDWWVPDVLHKLVECIENSRADIVLFGYNAQQPNGSFRPMLPLGDTRTFSGKGELLSLSQAFIHPVPEVSHEKMAMSVWSAMFRRSTVPHRFLSEREVASEDLPFKIEAVLNARKVLYLPLCVVNYRYNTSSLSRTYSFSKFGQFKTLTSRLRELYASTPVPGAGDFCMVYAAACAMQGMYSSHTPAPLRKQYIQAMAKDSIWDTVAVDHRTLPPKERFIIGQLKRHRWRPVWFTGEFFYSLKHLSSNRQRLSNRDVSTR